MARRAEGGYPQRSPAEKQRSQPAFSAKTLWAAGLLSVARVSSALTLGPRRLGHSHNPSPQDPTEFPKHALSENPAHRKDLSVFTCFCARMNSLLYVF